jgi:hypothetical protein
VVLDERIELAIRHVESGRRIVEQQRKLIDLSGAQSITGSVPVSIRRRHQTISYFRVAESNRRGVGTSLRAPVRFACHLPKSANQLT